MEVSPNYWPEVGWSRDAFFQSMKVLESQARVVVVLLPVHGKSLVLHRPWRLQEGLTYFGVCLAKQSTNQTQDSQYVIDTTLTVHLVLLL